LIDARATRRLTALELSDVDVPSAVNGPRRPPALFLRVLGSDGGIVRIELWERGEFCGARRLSVAQASTQLGARRVALAAAELARQLRHKRVVQGERAERERRRKEAEAALAADRTIVGPMALRPNFALLWLPDSELLASGPRLNLELDLTGAFRIDLGAEWLFATIMDRDARLSALGMIVAPTQRFVLGRTLDIDVGLEVGIATAHVDPVLAVDGIVGQGDTWTARAGAIARLQPRLSRNLRFSFGPSVGVVLRRMPVEFVGGEQRGLGGLWVGGEIGVVITPGGPD
jgi:hypothetical protein